MSNIIRERPPTPADMDVRGGIIPPVRPRRVRGSKFKEAEINKMLDLFATNGHGGLK
jgi:hypothetical protein